MSTTETPRRRRAPLVTGLTAAAITACVVAATAGPAAAATLPQAQSVGRFADGSLGNMAIQKLADVKDARATAPGTQSAQNPFDIKLFNAINLPLTNVFTIPTNPAVNAGAVNQVAQARTDGSSFGAAGAVANDGGITAGKKTDNFPTVARVNLSQAALGGAGALPLPSLPGAGSMAALGGVTAAIGAVSANARTQVGGKVSPTPMYNIAGLNLSLTSPALGAALTQLFGAFPTNAPSIGGLPTPPGTGTGTLAGITTACSFNAQLLSNRNLDNGAFTIDPKTATITISVSKLLKELNLDINTLPANTDLISYVLKYIADPNQLAKGLQNAINDLVAPLQSKFNGCLTAIGNAFPSPLDAVVKPIVTAITGGRDQLNNAVDMITTPLGSAAGGSPLQPLADGLKKVIDIGINVESGPGIQKQQTAAGLKFTTKLKKTPNQNTPVVPNQTLIRALEVNVLDTTTTSAPSNFGTPKLAAAPVPGLPNPPGLPTPGAGQTLLTLALANAAVGPSTAPQTAGPPATNAPGSPNTNAPAPPAAQVPTGIPAGQGTGGGSPTLPLVLILLTLAIGAGGVATYRFRGGSANH